MTLVIAPTVTAHIPDIAGILDATGVFTSEEVKVARELLDDAASPGPETTYRSLTALLDGRVAGYILFGPTPMTAGAWDLYWMAVDPALHGKGVGRGLVEAFEEVARAGGGRLVRVETSGLPEYEGTRAFYRATGYPEVSRIRDFYWRGADLCTHVKYL